MAYDRSPTCRTTQGPMQERRDVNALARIVVAAGALLAAYGCDHASASSKPVAPANAQTIAERQTPAAPVVTAPAANPQAAKYVSVVDAAKVIITGTSTLHDWTVNGGAIKGNAEFSGEWKPDAAGAIKLQAIDLAVDVDTLKSTEGGGMDDTMYDALKHKQFPSITYHLTKATFKSAPSKAGLPYQFDTTGQLTVAGGAHPVDLDLAIVPHDNGQLTISTNIGFKMTDFSVKPPTAMFGVVKSGDKVNVKVTWQLAPAPGSAGK